MTRHPDWAQRLNALVNGSRARPFEWGRWDCCLWPSDAVLAMTDVDIAAPLRGYDSRVGAALALRRGGYRSGVDVAEEALGAPDIMAYARRGDVVVYDRGKGARAFRECMGICMGQTSLFVGMYELGEGLVPMPTVGLVRCYHV